MVSQELIRPFILIHQNDDKLTNLRYTSRMTQYNANFYFWYFSYPTPRAEVDGLY